jgi:hypothetical protein
MAAAAGLYCAGPSSLIHIDRQMLMNGAWRHPELVGDGSDTAASYQARPDMIPNGSRHLWAADSVAGMAPQTLWAQIAVIKPSKRILTMRYYEIAQRPKTQTATVRIARGERHLEHDAEQIPPSGRGSRMSDNAARAKPHSAGTGSCHAPVPHPGRYGRVR